MAEVITFHFEGALADAHRMNFYESARFQYAAARLMVKLAQFRQGGRFGKKITNKSNFDIQLKSQKDGSFNINVEATQGPSNEGQFIDINLSDLIAYVSERIIGKIDESTLNELSGSGKPSADTKAGKNPAAVLEQLLKDAANDDEFAATLPSNVQDLIKRRKAEANREQRLIATRDTISRIDFARSQKLISMSAPLLSEMATALRRSANTLEVKSDIGGDSDSVLFLDQAMAREIETAIVDEEITPILGDITQFNKDNGWGKLKLGNGGQTLSFSIPSDILRGMKQKLIDNMKKDQVYLQAYYVRDRGGEVTRLIAVGVLSTPEV